MQKGAVERTKAIIVNRKNRFEESHMDELRSLAVAAGYEIVGMLEQVTRPQSRFHIGSGKAKELSESVANLGAEKIVFGNELKVVQIYNLAKLTGVETIDRLQLILEIFQKRASTEEANLQIQLARLRYEFAHAREKVRLARMEEQPGFLGLGKYQVEVYRESMRKQVHNIEAKLKNIRKTRELHRTRRRRLGFPLASLAGYTNSGKSTLFNALAEEAVPVDSSLFTTLSTTTRAVSLFGEKVLLTDTVGFVDNLPLTLVEAFRSTLEETIFSDLILLVVDVSEPLNEIERKISCCLDTIREIGVTGIPMVTVLNKNDLISTELLEERTNALKAYASNMVAISALHETNLDTLRKEMAEHLMDRVSSRFSVPINEKTLTFLSWVFDHADVQDVKYNEGSVDVFISAVPQIADKIRNDVESLGGVFRLDRMENLRSKAEPQVEA
jgi:GTP-binding protein HflX